MIIELKPEGDLVVLRGAVLDAVAANNDQEARRLNRSLQGALRERLLGVLSRYYRPIIHSGPDMVWRVDIRQPHPRIVGGIARNTA